MAVGTDVNDNSLDITIAPGGSSWSEHGFTTFGGPLSVQCTSTSSCIAEGTYQNEGTSGAIGGVYQTGDGGSTWSMLSQTITGDPGFVPCAASVCHEVGAGQLEVPTFDEQATSTDGAVSWSLDETPSIVWQLFSLTYSGARWIAVGVNQLGGPEILTSP